jgi:hypothetical protein
MRYMSSKSLRVAINDFLSFDLLFAFFCTISKALKSIKILITIRASSHTTGANILSSKSLKSK